MPPPLGREGERGNNEVVELPNRFVAIQAGTSRARPGAGPQPMIVAYAVGGCLALYVLTYPVQWVVRAWRRRRTRLAQGRVYWL